MKIAILGCGAMGTVLGAYLTKNGHTVELVDNYLDHVNAMNKYGARITGCMDLVIPVNAITPDQMEGIYDVVFLLTKQNVNDIVLPNLLPFLGEESTVCTLQNGVPEPFVAEYVGEKRTVGGTVLWGATFLKPGISELTQDITKNDHLFEIGKINGGITPRIMKVAEVLGLMGPVKVSDQLMNSRWGKLINNACMSGMSAACGATFGEVLENDVARACLSYLGLEVKACCEADGHVLPTLLKEISPESFSIADQAMFDKNQQMFLQMYEGMHSAKASMLQDLEKEKPSEVRMINGYVCLTGDKHGINTPFNDMVVEIVTKIEKGELPLSMDNLKYFDESLFKFQNYPIDN